MPKTVQGLAVEGMEAMEALDSAVATGMKVVAHLEGSTVALEGALVVLKDLEDVDRFPVSNAGLCRSSCVKMFPDNSAEGCLGSSAGECHDRSAASSVYQSGGARFATRMGKRVFDTRCIDETNKQINHLSSVLKINTICPLSTYFLLFLSLTFF